MTTLDTPFQVREGLHATEFKRLAVNEVPVIDFGGIYSPSFAERKKVGAAVRDACMHIGFFYIKNHAFPASVIKRAQEAMARFFALPVEEKMKIHYLASPNHRGYVPLKGIQADHSLKGGDLHEAIEMAHDLPEDDPHYLQGIRFYGPNNWPANPPDFRWALGTYFDVQLELGATICRAMALALDMPEDYFLKLYTKPMSRLRVCYYPPHEGKIDPAFLGIGAHTDYECFTTVWQDEPGLQVLNAAGEWIECPPIDGTFVVNLGDLMHRWTNDLFVSTMHRVINLSGRPRYSLAQFFGVDHDAVVEGLPTCCSPENPWRYTPITVAAHTEQMVAKTYHYAGDS
ncbi:MAG: isopenicillin N synthase family dioxygenase [Alphaproteobacteria bacterium]